MPGLSKKSSTTGFVPPGSPHSGSLAMQRPVIGGGDGAAVPQFLARIRAPAAALCPPPSATSPTSGSGDEEEGGRSSRRDRGTRGAAAAAAADKGEDKLTLGRKRVVFYPELDKKPRTEDSATPSRRNEIIAARMAKRTELDYHVPPATAKPANKKPKKPDEYDTYIPDPPKKKDEEEEEEEQQQTKANLGLAGSPTAVGGGALVAGASAGAGALNPDGTPKTPGGPEEEDEDETVIVDRYPVSPYGKLYFQVETDGATRLESVGIIIIDTEEQGIMMFDRVGRQFGNRPDPGYPIKQEDIDGAKAGVTLKVGTKSVLLMTALTEEAFRSGEFFLRSEHDMRVKEDKKKAKEAAEEAAVVKSTKPLMTFGKSFLSIGGGVSLLFAAQNLRKRPREGETGFTVPLAGRPKVGKNGLLEDLKPLHDHDRPGAVVLFRADYKRDVHGRRQVSVVVDPIIGDKLRPHQRIGVQFLFDCITGVRMPGYHGAILADEMGLGKTIQTVATIFTCLKQGKHGLPTARKCLVVAPSSLVQNWCNEFDKWLGEGAVKHFAISESTPKGDRIISRFDGEGDVLVISYDQLRKYIVRISGLKTVDLVVCDEGHRLKNAEVKTTKAVDMLPTRNRIILSGTPIQNDLSEFHAMVNFVNPGILGNRDLFARVFEEPVSIGRDPECPDNLKTLGHDRAHYLSVLTQRFILRRKQSINESYLPPKVDVTVYVRLGEVQEAAYQKLSSIVETASCPPLVLISALRKLCNHMDLFYDAVHLSHQPSARVLKQQEAAAAQTKAGGARGRGRTKESIHGIPLSVIPKDFKRGNLSQTVGSKLHFVSLVLDQLRSNGEHDKLVIVSNFTQTLDIIAALCKTKKIGYFQLDGSTPIKRRQELVDYFNVPGSQEIVFLLSSKAGGVGLNLIGANRLILFDPDWNPANDAQAMGRVWRDGQKKRVFIYRLLSTGTIEEKIYQRQVSKQGLSANVVDMQEDSKQHFTLDELKALFRYKADTLCDTHDLLDCTDCEAALAHGKKKKEVIPQAMKFRRVGGEKPKKTGPRMDELKAWQHISDIAHFALDKVTRAVAAAAPKLLTFLFADERDNTTKPAEQKLLVEKPFGEEGDDGIMCASQAACQEEESDLDIEIHAEDDDEESEEESEYISVGSSSDDDDEEEE